jgi:hypothetical protein
LCWVTKFIIGLVYDHTRDQMISALWTWAFGLGHQCCHVNPRTAVVYDYELTQRLLEVCLDFISNGCIFGFVLLNTDPDKSWVAPDALSTIGL